MKKYFTILLILVQIITFAGCSLPVTNNTQKPESTVSSSDGSVSDQSTADNTAEAANTAAVAEASSSLESVDSDKTKAAETGLKVGRISAVLYYQDSDGFLIPVTRWMEKQQGIARAALTGLIDSTITREELQYYGLYPVIPINTDILGINIKDEIATVDFDKNILELKDSSAEKRMLASVVYTLTGFKTISGVRIHINGFEQKELRNGTDISGVLTRENIMLNSSETTDGKKSFKTELFLLKKANDIFTYIAPVSVMLPTGGTDTDAAKVLNKLIQMKQDGSGIFNEMPQDAKVLNAAVKDGILTVDFSTGLQQYGGNAREEAILKQILYTAGQIKGVTKVKILIDGQTAILPEGTDLVSPISVPAGINDVIDNS